MPYEGDALNACGILNVDCSKIAVVAVTGSGPNVCGHLILGTGAAGNDLYFHVAGEFYTNPRYMTASGFQRYLKENGKQEIRRKFMALPDPNGAVRYLEQLLSKKWFWGILPHNCVSFVEDVINAGGGSWSSASNCPRVAISDSVEKRANRFMNEMDNAINDGINNMIGLGM
jgi:hypothetical protein